MNKSVILIRQHVYLNSFLCIVQSICDSIGEIGVSRTDGGRHSLQRRDDLVKRLQLVGFLSLLDDVLVGDRPGDQISVVANALLYGLQVIIQVSK